MRHTSAQRILDVFLSLAALVLLSPVIASVAVLVLVQDGRPVFFRQVRAGQHGQLFRLLKFRSMRVDRSGGPLLDRSLWVDGVPDNFLFKLHRGGEQDLTRTGAALRRLSLDELPQLVNVLRGEMSLVGPRPEILPIVECYSAAQRRRLAVKPGVTGWAQVNGRAESNHGAKLAADLYWVDHASLALYLQILARTAKITITGRGAF